MGDDRTLDQFYVVPTRVVREAIANWAREYLNTKKRNGLPRKDTGQWVLDLPGDSSRLNKGFAQKWAKYHDNWTVLETKRCPERATG
jgi:hypothetical protein